MEKWINQNTGSGFNDISTKYHNKICCQCFCLCSFPLIFLILSELPKSIICLVLFLSPRLSLFPSLSPSLSLSVCLNIYTYIYIYIYIYI